MLKLPAMCVPFQHPIRSSSECHSGTLPPPVLKSQHLPFLSSHRQKLGQGLQYILSEYNNFTLILCLVPLYMEDTESPREGHGATAESPNKSQNQLRPQITFVFFLTLLSFKDQQ